MINKIKNEFIDSFIYKAYSRIMEFLSNSVFFRFFSKSALSNEWYESFVYRGLTAPVRILKEKGIHSNIPVTSILLGCILAFLGGLPHNLWNDVYILAGFLVISILFILNTPDIKSAANYSVILLIFLICTTTVTIALWDSELNTLTIIFLFIAVCLSVLIMYITDEYTDVVKILGGVYIALFTSSVYVLFELLNGNSVMSVHAANPANYSEFLILFFPMALSFSIMQKDIKRKIIYSSFLIPSLLGIVFSYSKPGYIGFITSLLLYIILSNWRFTAAIVIIAAITAPMLSGQAVYYISRMWDYQNSLYYNESGLLGLINIIKDIYNRGIGVGSEPFLDIYSSAITQKNVYYYLQPMLEFVLLALVIFFGYIVRLIRKSIVLVFGAKSKSKNKSGRIALCAALSSLAGITVMSFFGINWLNPRTLLLYWSVIGIAAGITKPEREVLT